jgi:hypothetical protein
MLAKLATELENQIKVNWSMLIVQILSLAIHVAGNIRIILLKKKKISGQMASRYLGQLPNAISE